MKQIIYLPNPNNISMQTTVVDAYKSNNKRAGATAPKSILSLVYYSPLKKFSGCCLVLANLEDINVLNNYIIHGDNLKVLSKIKKQTEGLVKCIYIDPPYNNGEVYSHYDDRKEHKTWASNFEDTLTHLKPFLREDGSIWISIDDGNIHYARVIADRVFGQKNYLTTVIWQHRTTRENRKLFSNNHEYLLVYCLNVKKFTNSANRAKATEDIIDRYKNPDNDPRGKWQSISVNVQAGHAVASQFYSITSPSGKVHNPPKGRCWAYNEEKMKEEIEKGNIWFGRDGNGVPRLKKFLDLTSISTSHETIWKAEECGTNKSAKKHILKLFPDEAIFDTPKPEELIKKIFDISTVEGDLILDCFLGSGTTVAVAHKMNRKYIGVEIGNHVVDLVAKRLNTVIENNDPDGITKAADWKGGGSFNLILD